MKYYSILLSFIVLISCSDGPEVNENDLISRSGKRYLKTSTEPFSGVGVLYFGSGGKKAIKKYKDGISHGRNSSYFLDGTKESEVVHDNGTLTLEKTWYATGDLRSKITYTSPGNGMLETWWPSGKRKGIATFENGKTIQSSVTEWDMFGDEIRR